MIELRTAARRAAVGMCIHAAEDRQEVASEVLRLYMREAKDLGYTPCEALLALTQSAVGVAIGTNVGSEWFRNVAAGLAVKS